MKRVILLMIIVSISGCDKNKFYNKEIKKHTFEVLKEENSTLQDFAELEKIKTRYKGIFYGISNVEMKELRIKDKKHTNIKFPFCNATKKNNLLEIELHMGTGCMEGENILIKFKSDSIKTEIRHFNNCMGGSYYYPSKIIEETIILNKKEYAIGDTLTGKISIRADKITREMKLKKMTPIFRDKKLKSQFVEGKILAIVR